MKREQRPDEDLTEDLAAFFEKPKRTESQYSERAMRSIHEGRAQYAPPQKTPRKRKAPPPPVEPEIEEEADEEEAPRPRKKHRFLKFLFKLCFFVLVLAALAGGLLLLFSHQPKTDQPIAARRGGCASILLAGTDATSGNTDTIMLLFLDSRAKEMRLLSIPRDTMVNRSNPVPKINGAYFANGSRDDGSFDPAKGMESLMDYTQDLIGYRPDGYVLIDLDCFEGLVNTMGGVEYEVPMDMVYDDPVQDLHINLKQGLQHLNGEQAMWLVRFRSGYAAADLERVNVQRSFLSAAIDQWSSVRSIPRLPFAAKLVLDNTTTDLSLLELTWVAKTVFLCRANLESNTLPGGGQTINGGSYYVESVYDAAALINEDYNPYADTISASGLHPYGR